MRERRVGARRGTGQALRALRFALVRWAAVLASGAVGGDVASAHAAEVVLAVPAWVGQPAAGGRLQLAVGASSARVPSGPLAASREGWMLAGAVAWPDDAGGATAGHGVRLAGGLRELRFDVGAAPGATELAYTGSGGPLRVAFSGRGMGWSLDGELKRPVSWRGAARQETAGGEGSGVPSAHPEFGVSAQLAWFPVAGPATREDAGAEGMAGFEERETGHAAFKERRAAVGVSLWWPRRLAGGSRLSAGASAGFSHSHVDADYRGAFYRWMGEMPVTAGERWARAAESLDVLALSVGLAWQRGPVGVALSGGALAGGRIRRDARAERLDPQAEPVYQERAAAHPVRGYHAHVELFFSAGTRITYRLAAVAVALADGGAGPPEPAGSLFAGGIPQGPPWVVLPLAHRTGLAAVPADGHVHWRASVTLEL